MFGFSLPKLLVLIALVAIVWYGFKALGRLNRNRQMQAKQATRNRISGTAVRDMIQCPECGAYSASLDSHKCKV